MGRMCCKLLIFASEGILCRKMSVLAVVWQRLTQLPGDSTGDPDVVLKACTRYSWTTSSGIVHVSSRRRGWTGTVLISLARPTYTDRCTAIISSGLSIKNFNPRYQGSAGLAKPILQDTVKGGRRQGGQRKRWEDNIRERTGLEFAKSQRAVENRGKWRKLVAKSSVVPQRPSRLRNR